MCILGLVLTLIIMTMARVLSITWTPAIARVDGGIDLDTDIITLEGDP